jgi:hypothetical protein
MPFVLYERTTSDDGSLRYFALKEVSLAGTSTGLIHPFVTSYARPGRPFPWHATVKDLLGEAGIDPKNRAVLIDTKPLLEGNLSLYELTDVMGYSHSEWTPICLRMMPLVVDQTVPDPERFKLKFRAKARRRQTVHQFLYLQGGVDGGSWTWGPVGSVNGVLLFPDALGFFLEMLGADEDDEE